MPRLSLILLPFAMLTAPLAAQAQDWRDNPSDNRYERAPRQVYWDGNCRVEQRINREGELIERRSCRGDGASYARANRQELDEPRMRRRIDDDGPPRFSDRRGDERDLDELSPRERTAAQRDYGIRNDDDRDDNGGSMAPAPVFRDQPPAGFAARPAPKPAPVLRAPRIVAQDVPVHLSSAPAAPSKPPAAAKARPALAAAAAPKRVAASAPPPARSAIAAPQRLARVLPKQSALAAAAVPAENRRVAPSPRLASKATDVTLPKPRVAVRLAPVKATVKAPVGAKVARTSSQPAPVKVAQTARQPAPARIVAKSEPLPGVTAAARAQAPARERLAPRAVVVARKQAPTVLATPVPPRRVVVQAPPSLPERVRTAPAAKVAPAVKTIAMAPKVAPSPPPLPRPVAKTAVGAPAPAAKAKDERWLVTLPPEEAEPQEKTATERGPRETAVAPERVATRNQRHLLSPELRDYVARKSADPESNLK